MPVSASPTGITSRPPIASCSFSASGTLRPARRDEDRVEGRVLGPAERAVADAELDIVVAELRQPPRAPRRRATAWRSIAKTRSAICAITAAA